jgi:hypothetical protein
MPIINRPQSQTREEQAKLEIGQTEISFGVKWTLVVVGLLTLFAVPIVQTCHEMRQYAEWRRANPWPQFCDIFDALPRAVTAFREHNRSWFSKTFRANTILLQAANEYEKNLKADSFLTKSVLPPIQEGLAHIGGGNEEGYVGRQRWLFYRPGIDYCTGPGFLNRPQLARRAESDTTGNPASQPDPRKAILQFHRQLAQRDIQLVLMPIPDKATLHPEKFSSRYEGRLPSIHNPSYRQFLDELEAEGVLVCDVTDVLAQYRDHAGEAIYLATDTHWRPETMQLAATELARFIENNISLGVAAIRKNWQQTSATIANMGDIATMLKLRQSQDVFDPETVTINPVTDSDGQPWQPDSTAEILLLGDSFANIYSLEMMNWGGGAGFAEQLTHAMNRPVDTILRNDNGSYATREILGRELAQGEDRLAGKKVVVWQFAARELAVGDWRLLDMPCMQFGKSASVPQPAESELIVSGTIAAKSSAPRAGRIPYAHHIFTIDLTDLQVHSGMLPDKKIGVYLLSMRDHQNTPAFSWPIGQQVKLKLQPWSPTFFRQYGRINRSETKDIQLKRPWWGEVVK